MNVSSLYFSAKKLSVKKHRHFKVKPTLLKPPTPQKPIISERAFTILEEIDPDTLPPEDRAAFFQRVDALAKQIWGRYIEKKQSSI